MNEDEYLLENEKSLLLMKAKVELQLEIIVDALQTIRSVKE
jgi:hypothetical protein|tara:strand:- start:26368 stop:26490 length:123 start_codon:yes stop_codon:yes gene_type:complete